MEGMMLHCGAAEATFDELKAVQLPENHPRFRDAMDHYQTVPHHQLVSVIRTLLKEMVHENAIVGEQFGLSTGQAYPGAKMFGLFKLDIDGGAVADAEEIEDPTEGAVDPFAAIEDADTSDPEGYALEDAAPTNVDDPATGLEIIDADAISPTLVIRNSYDRSMSIAGGLGYNCFICDNLALSGEIMFARKHTKRAMGDIMHIFTSLVSTLGEQFQFDQEFREAAKGMELTQDGGFEILGRMAGNSLLPFVGGEQSQFAVAVKEWRNPTHETFAERNLWSLFNAVTAAQHKEKIQHRLETGSTASKVFRGILGETWESKAEEISAKYAEAARVR